MRLVGYRRCYGQRELPGLRPGLFQGLVGSNFLEHKSPRPAKVAGSTAILIEGLYLYII